MVINTVASPKIDRFVRSTGKAKTRITVFHCFNALSTLSPESDGLEILSVKMPCSSMTRGIHLLRAFEAGADAVLVLVCPEGTCRYLEGNIRARKRVEYVKKLLDEIGLDRRRLNIFNVPHGDQTAVERIINRTVLEIAELGSNPAP